MDKKVLCAEADSARVDVFVSEGAGITRSAAKKLIEGGHVLQNSRPAKASAPVKRGDVIEVQIPDPVPIEAQPEDIPLRIIYEDDDIAVVDKPQGMTVHAGAGNRAGTLVNALLFRLKSLSGVGGAIRPGIVHRIDKDTSGLLVVAKNDAAHLSLSEQIKDKTCRREYLALLEGVIKDDEGHIATYIGRDPKDRLKMAVLPAGQGRRAETDFFVVGRYRENCLVRFRLQTGRTHQIRVHAKHLGHPVVGDKTYGYKKQRFELQGQLLHACALELTHPRTGERMRFESPLPDYFERVLNIVKKEK